MPPQTLGAGAHSVHPGPFDTPELCSDHHSSVRPSGFIPFESVSQNLQEWHTRDP